MDCPECGTWGFKTTCKKCKYSTAKAKSEKYPTITGRTDTIVSRDCDFKTGEWRCQWGKWASDKAHTVFCDFHQLVMEDLARHGTLPTTHEQWQQFQREYQWNQTHRTRDAWAYPDGTFPTTPFWFQSIQECWRDLTGLPLPTDFSPQEVSAEGVTP